MGERSYIINEDGLKKEVIVELQKIAEEGRRRYSEMIETQFSAHLTEISKELLRQMENIYSRYKILEESGQVGPLEWVYISFLRTGFVDKSPCYRIDFYDSRGCISDIECAGTWGFDFIFDLYYSIEEQIIKQAEKQSCLKPYEAEEIIIALADYFRQQADSRIPQLAHAIKADISHMVQPGQKIKIMLGEFLDSTEVVLEMEALQEEIP